MKRNLSNHECVVAASLPDGVFKLYSAPVRTKDLTDDEICRMWNDWHDVVGAGEFALIARAVIAADREKNR